MLNVAFWRALIIAKLQGLGLGLGFILASAPSPTMLTNAAALRLLPC
jgi:hypothetical protein